MTPEDQITGSTGADLVQIGQDTSPRYAERVVHGMTDYFRCTWVRRVSDFEDSDRRSVRVIPDNCADFIVSSAGDCWLVGPATGVDLPHHAPGTVLRGLRIHPAALQSVIDADGNELTDRRASFDDLLSSRRARLLADALWHDAIDGRLLRQLWLRLDLDPRVTAGIRALTTASNRSVDEIAADSALSPRQFRRLIRQVSGLTPKTLQRVSRLHHVLEVAGTAPNASLAMLAAMAGFTDQSHLARDVRDLADLTPRQLLREHV